MILVIQQYEPESADRRKELRRCLSINESSHQIDEIVVLDGSKGRLTFGDMFRVCHERFGGELCVVANSDIAFDATFGLREVCREGRLVCLTRWEDESGPRFIGHQINDRFYSGSQDAWAFIGGSLPQIDFDIWPGIPACEQLLNGWAVLNGIHIVDPSLSVKTRHIHASRVRHYDTTCHGFFAYPQMTTADRLGTSALCHLWPTLDGRYVIEPELRTWAG